MSRMIRIGTRKSALALAQSEIVAGLMKQACPDVEIEFATRTTEGDRILHKPLLEFGGKGVFVTELEQALLAGEIDFAVHSAKDLPMVLEDGLDIVAVPKREDPRDVLVTMSGTDLGALTEIVIGTSSQRRILQIQELGKELWPGANLRCENIRGNVKTRLDKMEAGGYHGLILAAAGLKRLGLHTDKRYSLHYFDCEAFIPAGGQGILAVEGRAQKEFRELEAAIEDEEARICLTLERRILKLLGAGCHEPIGVYSRITNGQIELFGINSRNGEIKRIHMTGSIGDMELLAENGAKGLG